MSFRGLLSTRTSNIIIKPRKPFRLQTPTLSALRQSRTYTSRRYTRFDDQRDDQEGKEEDDLDREFRRKFEFFRLYGTGALVIGAGTIWYIAHLEQVPETKRWRYMDASKGMIQMLEKQSYEEIMHEYGRKILPMNHPATRLVQTVAERLITRNGLGHVVTRPVNSGADQKPDEWLVYVVDEKIQNAFVAPGRKIVVFSGMLHQVADEDQLAGILAHEVAHQLIGHVLEKVSLTRLIFIADVAIQFLLGTNTGLSGLALQALIALPNSRTQELEADLVGLRLMSKACFDPGAVVKFWQSFDKQDKYQPPAFLSTHPGHRQRAAAIEGWVPAVRSEYPCQDMVEFSHAFDQGRRYSGVGMDIRRPSFSTSAPPARQAQPQSRQPSPISRSEPSPDSGDWTNHDPWSSDSNGSSGGEADWGMQDPWASKNDRSKGSSW
ncbi:hypothetical protein PIIN_01429 [Serendipita indica DSM 11827]|uniref:Peptidase M48 domain-containing protein n=1 Tax=Serendipita indica (strain DSM 11827) TaxID=1109443 RepID=G4T8E1_SERID|nr:hypothetical protein PIIN_01429 [Serendipita indica DSM 11827]